MTDKILSDKTLRGYLNFAFKLKHDLWKCYSFMLFNKNYVVKSKSDSPQLATDIKKKIWKLSSDHEQLKLVLISPKYRK